MECSKQDWNLFKSKIAGWQESYMEKLNKEYMEILSGNESASDKFWKLEERIKRDRKRTGVIINLRKSDMVFDMVALISDDAIKMEDLKQLEDYYIIQFDVDTALKVSDNILNAVDRLELFPESGSLTPDNWLNEMGYRMVICEKYVAIYKKIGEVVYHIGNAQTEYTKLFY